MFLLGMLGAAALSLGDVGSLLKLSDYPSDALEHEQSVAALLEIVIDPSGKVASCTVVSVVGNYKLAGQLCEIVRRKKTSPATLSDGTRTYARVRSGFRMFVPGAEGADKAAAAQQSADQVLTASYLPAGKEGRAADLALAVDAQGQIIDCAPTPHTKNPDIAALGCKARASLHVEPLILPDGSRPVFVSSSRIEFHLAAE